jgi:hypothetical protein
MPLLLIRYYGTIIMIELFILTDTDTVLTIHQCFMRRTCHYHADKWNHHVSQFVPACLQKGYYLGRTSEDPNCFESSKKVFDMNNIDNKKLDTQAHKYAWLDDYMTVCHLDGLPAGEEHLIVLHQNRRPQFRTIPWDDEGFELVKTRSGYNTWIPCKVLERDVSTQTLDVVYFRKHESDPDSPLRYLRRNKKLPVDQFQFLMKPYKGDSLWKGAFRQPIALPDHMFPKQWMDLTMMKLPPVPLKQVLREEEDDDQEDKEDDQNEQ